MKSYYLYTNLFVLNLSAICKESTKMSGLRPDASPVARRASGDRSL